MLFLVLETLDHTDYQCLDSSTGFPCSTEERRAYEFGTDTEIVLHSFHPEHSHHSSSVEESYSENIPVIVKFRQSRALFSEE